MFKYSEKVDQLLGTLEVTSDDCTIDEDSLQFLAQIVYEDKTDQNTSKTPAYAETNRNSNDNNNPKCSTSHQSESHGLNGKQIGLSLHKCYICDEVFTSTSGLYNHMNSHTKGIHFVCKSCSKSFSKLGDLCEHVRRVHEKQISALKSPNMHPLVKSVKKRLKRKCFICSKYYSSLPQHINGMHTKEISYKCKFCPKVYNYRSSLRQHTKYVHINQVPEWICNNVAGTQAACPVN